MDHFSQQFIDELEANFLQTPILVIGDTISQSDLAKNQIHYAANEADAFKWVQSKGK